jgi:hypothetical protein
MWLPVSYFNMENVEASKRLKTFTYCWPQSRMAHTIRPSSPNSWSNVLRGFASDSAFLSSLRPSFLHHFRQPLSAFRTEMVTFLTFPND